MREKLIEVIHDFSVPIESGGCTIGEYIVPYSIQEQIADHLIANGVTIPVRCKDCKRMEKTPYGLRLCHVWDGINGMGDEGYCNYGERKDYDQETGEDHSGIR